MKLAGGCHCGNVRFSCDGEVTWAGHCHCRTCQLTSGAPFVTWITMAKTAVTIDGKCRVYRSSDHAVRSFCPHCGCLLFYESDYHKERMDIVVACLDEPDLISPTFNIFVSTRPRFMKGFDAELPSYEESAPGQ